jgi:hypothetical protein
MKSTRTIVGTPSCHTANERDGLPVAEGLANPRTLTSRQRRVTEWMRCRRPSTTSP